MADDRLATSRGPYAWARRSIPAHHATLGEVAWALGVGPERARQIVREFGAPARVCVKHWRDPLTGQGFTRRAWSVPQPVLELLVRERAQRIWRELEVATPGRWRQRLWRLRSHFRLRWETGHFAASGAATRGLGRREGPSSYRPKRDRPRRLAGAPR